jgi:SAM-dependent methyltransferase
LIAETLAPGRAQSERAVLKHEASAQQRFEELRRGWFSNAPLRALYAYWYSEIRTALAPVLPGVVVELGSGPSFSKQFLPGIRTSDMIRTTGHDYQIDATRPWPFRDHALDGVVLFDVLHHLAAPRVLFGEAARTLRPGGRLIMMEPYVSPLSYPFYRFLHVEGLDTSVEPLSADAPPDKDPFDGNQAVPGIIFGKCASQFRQDFPKLRIAEQRLYSGFSYVASGGYSRPPLVPKRIWSALFRLDRQIPNAFCSLVAFRMLVAIERA